MVTKVSLFKRESFRTFLRAAHRWTTELTLRLTHSRGALVVFYFSFRPFGEFDVTHEYQSLCFSKNEKEIWEDVWSHVIFITVISLYRDIFIYFHVRQLPVTRLTSPTCRLSCWSSPGTWWSVRLHPSNTSWWRRLFPDRAPPETQAWHELASNRSRRHFIHRESQRPTVFW